MKQPPASVFLELESLLVQVERLTAELIAGLNQCQYEITVLGTL